MITVTLRGPGGLFDQAEADDPENAIFAGQTLFDEACQNSGVQGFHKALVLIFEVAGETVRVLTGVRP